MVIKIQLVKTLSKEWNSSCHRLKDWKLIFYWTIIGLQCCVSFQCTIKWINYTYTYIPSLLSLPPTPIPSLQVPTEHWTELPVLYSHFPLAICFIHDSVYMSKLLSQFIPPSLFPSCVHKSVLYICASIPAQQIGLSYFSRFLVPFF